MDLINSSFSGDLKSLRGPPSTLKPFFHNFRTICTWGEIINRGFLIHTSHELVSKPFRGNKAGLEFELFHVASGSDQFVLAVRICFTLYLIWQTMSKIDTLMFMRHC